MNDNDEINLKDLVNNKYFWVGLISAVFLITRLPLISAYSTVWWDEAQYLVMTKSLFIGTPTTGWWDGRSIVYPAILYGLSLPFGYNELVIRFINILFGLGLTIASYYLGKELLGEKYGIITGLIMCFQWVFLYWSLRFTIDVPSAFLLVLSALLFIKGKRLPSGLLLGLAASIKFTAIIGSVVYLAYSLINKEKKLKDYYWLFGALIGYAPLMIYDIIVFNNPVYTPLSFLSFNVNATGGAQAGDMFYYITSMLFNYGILMGLLVFIGIIPIIFKLKNKKVQFIALNLFIYLAFYSLLTSVKEVRFLIHLLPFACLSAILGASFIISYVSKNKQIINYALAIITIIIIIENLPTGLTSINNAKDSYLYVKQAGEFLLPYEGNVMANSVPQLTYYSEKTVDAFPATEELFLQQVSNYSFLVISAYEQYPAYAYTLNYSFIMPIKAYPSAAQAQLIVFYINNSA
ncbi:MAG: glycosyltransferase family 39 protein [Candidatus Nanoarchaeia archaeon]|jgi:4-amino-4-deoxy-L-arabinose transferase-like glycosyltransferase